MSHFIYIFLQVQVNETDYSETQDEEVGNDDFAV